MAGKDDEFKAVVSAEFSSVQAALSALISLQSEGEVNNPKNRAKIRLTRVGKEIVVNVEAQDAPSCRAALNSVLRLIELLKPMDTGS